MKSDKIPAAQVKVDKLINEIELQLANCSGEGASVDVEPQVLKRLELAKPANIENARLHFMEGGVLTLVLQGDDYMPIKLPVVDLPHETRISLLDSLRSMKKCADQIERHKKQTLDFLDKLASRAKLGFCGLQGYIESSAESVPSTHQGPFSRRCNPTAALEQTINQFIDKQVSVLKGLSADDISIPICHQTVNNLCNTLQDDEEARLCFRSGSLFLSLENSTDPRENEDWLVGDHPDALRLLVAISLPKLVACCDHQAASKAEADIAEVASAFQRKFKMTITENPPVQDPLLLHSISR